MSILKEFSSKGKNQSQVIDNQAVAPPPRKNRIGLTDGKRFLKSLIRRCPFYLQDVLVIFRNLSFIYEVIRDRYTFYNPDTKKYESLKKENSKTRLEGICGVMRVYNEEQFIEASILRVVKALDELVIVLNKCTDRTPCIVYSLKEKYPNKIKIYNYEYEVYSCFSEEHKNSRYNDPKNLANFYNYSFTRSNYQIVVKLDADMLFDEKLLKEKCDLIRKKFSYKYVLYFFGLNTFRSNHQDYFYGDELQASYGDHRFYKLSKYNFYDKNDICEFHKSLSFYTQNCSL